MRLRFEAHPCRDSKSGIIATVTQWSGPKICAAIASRIKLDVRLFSAAIGSSAVNERVIACARRAFERGAFGVPTFFVGDRMFWGNDRLVLLEHYLAHQGRR